MRSPQKQVSRPGWELGGSWGPLGFCCSPEQERFLLLPADGQKSGPSEQLLFLGPLEGDLRIPASCSVEAT